MSLTLLRSNIEYVDDINLNIKDDIITASQVQNFLKKKITSVLTTPSNKNNNHPQYTKHNTTPEDQSTLSNIDLNTCDNSSYNKNVDNPKIAYVHFKTKNTILNNKLLDQNISTNLVNNLDSIKRGGVK